MVRYQLNTPYRDGTTHVIFEPLDFIARQAALVPRPRVNLSRFYGVFAPNSKYRALVTPAKRGKGNKLKVPDDAHDQTPAERRAAMTWAQRLKRVFNIDIETCRECGGAMKVIACIEDPVVIKKVLDHLKEKGEYQDAFRLPEGRGSPQTRCVGKENPFGKDKDVAGDTRQGSRSAAGPDWADHKAEIRPTSPVRLLQ